MEFKGIKETCLYTRDLDAAENFYHGQLGLEIISYVPGRHIFFKVGYSVLLVFNPDDSKLKKTPPPHYGQGALHFAFEVAPDEYLEWKRKIAVLNIPIIDELVWASGQESFYFHDPEGNVLELFQKESGNPVTPTLHDTSIFRCASPVGVVPSLL